MNFISGNQRTNWKTALERLITSIVREGWFEYQSNVQLRELWWWPPEARPKADVEEVRVKLDICYALGQLITIPFPGLSYQDNHSKNVSSKAVLDALAFAFGSSFGSFGSLLYPGTEGGSAAGKEFLRDVIENWDSEIEDAWYGPFELLISTSSLRNEYLRPFLTILAICIAALDEETQKECVPELKSIASFLVERAKGSLGTAYSARISPTFLSELAGDIISKVSTLDFDARDPSNALTEFAACFVFHPDADVEEVLPVPNESVAAIISELTEMVGLDAVKREVISLANFIKVQQLRKARGLRQPPISKHLVFSGNPGTGKTTVARLVARLYAALGVLAKGHLVEVDRGGLVSQYVGGTAIKTKEAVLSALDGVLFIDEAYSLYKETTWGDVGSEAVETLLKLMEDYRERLVVIAAGYTDRMNEFIASNPGLQSRFTRQIEFKDYCAEEMVEIFERFAVSNNFELQPEAKVTLLDYLSSMVGDNGFGNGRGARNLFEASIVAHANRIATIPLPSDRDLRVLVRLDIIDAIEA